MTKIYLSIGGMVYVRTSRTDFSETWKKAVQIPVAVRQLLHSSRGRKIEWQPDKKIAREVRP